MDSGDEKEKKKGGLRDEVKNANLVLNNKISRQKLKSGDHIYCHHGVSFDSHHGIYVGDDQVIHFIPSMTKIKPKKGASPCKKCDHLKNVHHGIVKTCLDCFVSEGSRFVTSHSLHLYQYNVPTSWYTSKRSGSFSTFPSYPPDEVIDMADGHFLDNGTVDYSMLYDDDESFAIYCKTGVAKSKGDCSGEKKKKKKKRLPCMTGGDKKEDEEDEEDEEEQ